MCVLILVYYANELAQKKTRSYQLHFRIKKKKKSYQLHFTNLKIIEVRDQREAGRENKQSDMGGTFVPTPLQLHPN